MSDLKIIDEEKFEIWVERFGNTCSETTIEVTENLADFVEKESIKELQAIQRKTKMPKNRGVHLYQDVKKVKSKKYGYISIGGGQKTATLWHIVNDGTYRTMAKHFIEKVLAKADQEIDRIWESKKSDLEG